jgi:hypothetical protein
MESNNLTLNLQSLLVYTLVSYTMSIQKLIRNIRFSFDYHVGYHLTNAHKHDVWREYMFTEYPEFYQNELAYLKEKEENERSKEQEQVSSLDIAA